MSTTTYSPKPLASYDVPSRSVIFSQDEQAWNLAYLSYDFDTRDYHPDPNFSTHVRRTLQFVIQSGELDIAGVMPVKCLVRGYITGPAPQAALKLSQMTRLHELPMYKAYGQKWIDTVLARSHLFREPHDKKLDITVENMSIAMAIIDACK